jgi:transcriptional antiterminator Rof (Rho-off)
MGHQLDRCDFIDVLEEAVLRRSTISVDLRDGRHFSDQVRDVVTDGGADFAVFANHGTIAVRDIALAGRIAT